MQRFFAILAAVVWVMPSLCLGATSSHSQALSRRNAETTIRRSIHADDRQPQHKVMGKITKIEAICSSQTCTRTQGEWIVDINEKLADNLTAGFIVDVALTDLREIEKSAFSSGIRIRWVDVQGSYPLTDRYGNRNMSTLFDVRLYATTAKKINWHGISSQNLWDLNRKMAVSPEFQQYLPSDQ